MFRHKPSMTYNGLTVVLSNPSRVDKTMLMEGLAGQLFNSALTPYGLRYNCDIRTSDTINDGLLDNTRGILLLGERAFHEWSSGYNTYSINEQRGCPLDNKWNLPCVASYSPQDCVDFQDWESKYNPLASYGDEGNEDEYEESGKKHGATARSNYPFWFRRDLHKLCSKISGKRVGGIQDIALSESPAPNYIIYPNDKNIIDWLRDIKDETLYIDIETEIANYNMFCIGLSSSSTNDIYVVPIKRYNWSLAYNTIPHILRALSKALIENEIVVHNALFDLMILAWRYKIPCGRRIWDTMLAQHRLFPEIEKSLGHCMSMWTWEKFHKDQGSYNPQSPTQERALWEYNGKDVFGMKLIHQRQLQYASRNPGHMASIIQSNDMIRPYLINTLFGMRVDDTRRLAMLALNDRFMTQFVRCAKILVGEKAYKEIQGKSKSNILASPDQCVKYFHGMLGYKEVKKSKKTGNASLDADAIYRLKLEYPDNPVLDLVLAYRGRAKESGTLKFNYWNL